MNRIQIGAALGLAIVLGGRLGMERLLTPVAARVSTQDPAATIAMLEQRLADLADLPELLGRLSAPAV